MKTQTERQKIVKELLKNTDRVLENEKHMLHKIEELEKQAADTQTDPHTSTKA